MDGHFWAGVSAVLVLLTDCFRNPCFTDKTCRQKLIIYQRETGDGALSILSTI
jgi:hypothetical protein